jgi:hypothetical protein
MKNKKGQESQKPLIVIVITLILFFILIYAVRYLIKRLTGGS